MKVTTLAGKASRILQITMGGRTCVMKTGRKHMYSLWRGKVTSHAVFMGQNLKNNIKMLFIILYLQHQRNK